MSAVVIQNFKHGLDTRRSILTSVLGTLVTLENAYVNQGGEIEKRKAFVQKDMSVGKPVGVTIMAVQPVKDSIVILGKGENTSLTWPASLGSNPTFTYQRLLRANSTGGFGQLEPASVVYSTTYDGKVFALCQMFDGTYNAFYDGEFVPDINVLGVVLPVGDFFGYLKDQIDATELYSATNITDGLRITALPGQRFGLTFSKTGTWSEDPVVTFLSAGTPPVEGRKASGYFTIKDGVYRLNGGHEITSVAVRIHSSNGNTVSTTELLPAAVQYTVDPEATAAAVTAAINANSTTSGYNAKNTGNVVALFANATGTTANNAQIRVNTTGSVMIGDCSITLSGTAFTLDHIKADGKDLLGTPLVFPTAGETLAAFVSRVVAEIHNNTSAGLAHGYIAMSRGNLLRIAKKLTTSYVDPTPGTDAFPRETRVIPVDVKVTPTTTGTGVIGEGEANELVAQIEPTPVEIGYSSRTIISGYTVSKYWYASGAPIRAMAGGGTPPYTYHWSLLQTSGFGNGGFTSTNTELTSLTDSRPDNPGAYAAKVQLEVTDAGGNKVTRTADVLFRIN